MQRAQEAPARAPPCHAERSEASPPRCSCAPPMRCFRRVTGLSMTACMESGHRQRAHAAPALAPQCHAERSEASPPRCSCAPPMRCFRRITGVSMTACMESVDEECACSVHMQHPHLPHDVTLSGAKGLLHDAQPPPMRCFRRVTGVSMTAGMESGTWRGDDQCRCTMSRSVADIPSTLRTCSR